MQRYRKFSYTKSTGVLEKYWGYVSINVDLRHFLFNASVWGGDEQS